MIVLYAIVAFTVLALAAGYYAREALRVFEVTVLEGRLVRVRGRLSAELEGELSDIVERDSASGKIAVHVDGDRARVVTSETIGEGTAQRVRNVIGRFPLVRLRTAKRR